MERALREFGRIVGQDWLLASDADRDGYRDVYALGDGREHRPAAAEDAGGSGGHAMSRNWSRRRVLGATLGIVGVACLPGRGPRAAAARPDAATLPGAPRLVVVQDGRYAASRRHADELAPRAQLLVDARDDLARLWYRDLAASAARTPLMFAGLTTWSDYLVLKGCAAEAGLRAARHELIRNTDRRGCTLVRWQIRGAST